MRMSQREEQIARLQAERDAYESRLPPQIRDSIERRLERGFDVPYRPIPEAALRVLEAAGPNVTQAQIQWAYDMRNRGEGPAVRSSPPDALAATPRRRDNPMAMPDEMGQLPYDEPLVGSEERVGGAPETEMTEEDMVARERDRIRSANENRTEGAPDVQVYGETPSSYMRDLQSATDMAARSDRRDWVDPGSPEAFGLESDLLQFREGMTDAEYEAAKANIRHRQRLLRGMGPDAGGYTAFNPQQPMYLGTAEDQEEWEAFLRDNPEAQERYDPAAYQANKAAADKAAMQKHSAGLRARADEFVGDAAAEYERSQTQGGPVDYSKFRSSAEDMRVRDYDRMSRRARGGGDRSEMNEIDARSGSSGALTNDKIIDDGSGESYGSRFARRSAERDAELDARRRAYSARNMLAGNDPRSNLTNAFNLLPPEEQTAAILGAMFPQGATPLDVQRANNEQLAELGKRVALGQGFQAPTAMEQAALDAQKAQLRLQMFDDVTSHIRKEYSGGRGLLNSEFDSQERDAAVKYLTAKYDISQPEAEEIVDAAARQFKQPPGSPSPQAPPATAQTPPQPQLPPGRSGARQGGGRSGRQATGIQLPPAVGRGRSGTRPGVTTPRSR